MGRGWGVNRAKRGWLLKRGLWGLERGEGDEKKKSGNVPGYKWMLMVALTAAKARLVCAADKAVVILFQGEAKDPVPPPRAKAFT